VEEEAFRAAKLLAITTQKEKLKFDKQRKCLLKTAIKIAVGLSGVSHGCTASLDHEDEDEVARLTSLLDGAHCDLGQASEELERLVREKAQVI
jgi:hypothetical protein